MGVGHHHPDRHRGGRAAALLVLIPVAMLIVGAMVWMWPAHPKSDLSDDIPRANGHITAIAREACPQLSVDDPAYTAASATATCGIAQVAMRSGPHAGTTVPVRLAFGPDVPKVAVGDDVVLTYLADSFGAVGYQIVDHQRGNQLWALAIALALAVVAFGRLRGLAALAGLAVTFTILLWFIVPAILAGQPPLPVAIVGSAAIMFTVLYLTHGLRRSTTIAVAGTLASLTLTAILAAISVAATHLSGFGTEDALNVGLTTNINMQGLLLAGIVIGALGVLDDVTVTQAVTVDELATANSGYGFRQLYTAATRIGRAHIASVVNTIILAYAGASMPLLILIATSNQSAGRILTNQALAEELVRGMVGTIGLIAAVPITTALAAWAAVRSRRPEAIQTPAPRPPADLDRGWEPDTGQSASWPPPAAPTGWSGWPESR
jgi:uncharacterized membrane protein